MVRDETFYARLDADDVMLLRRVDRSAPNYSGRPMTFCTSKPKSSMVGVALDFGASIDASAQHTIIQPLFIICNDVPSLQLRAETTFYMEHRFVTNPG